MICHYCHKEGVVFWGLCQECIGKLESVALQDGMAGRMVGSRTRGIDLAIANAKKRKGGK